MSVQKKQGISLIHSSYIRTMKEASLDGIDGDILLTKTYNPHHADLADELSAILSLDELETRIYLNLLRTGPITASALSKEINIDRAKAYRTIDKMSNDGIVSISFSSPKLCIATDPDEILSLALRKKEEELIKIKKGGKQIIEKIKKVVNTDNKTNVPTFRVIQGIENISSQIERILEGSTGTLYFVTTLTDVSRLYHSKIPEKIRLAQRAGVDVRLIVDDVPPKMTPFVKRFGLSEVRIGKLPSKGRMVVSKNCPVTGRLLMSDSAVRGTLHENTDTECALFTNSEEMTNNIFTLCDFLWKTSNQLII